MYSIVLNISSSFAIAYLSKPVANNKMFKKLQNKIAKNFKHNLTNSAIASFV